MPLMQSMRKGAQSPVMKVVLAVLIFSFAVWGIGDMVSGGGSTVAARINGEPVHVQDVLASYERLLADLRQQVPAQMEVTPQIITMLNLPVRAFQEVVQEALIQSQADTLNLAVPDEMVADVIRNNTQFHNEDGTFDAPLYRQTLANAGMTVEVYEARVRQSLRNAMLGDVFADIPPQTDSRIAAYIRRATTQISVNALTLDAEDVTPAAITTADISQAYEAATDTLLTPEYRAFHVLALSPNALKPDIIIPQEDLKAAYEANTPRFRVAEQRRVRHILVDDEARAAKLRARLADGADFSALAAEASIDAATAQDGGSIGYIGRDDAVEAFTDAAFTLEEGTLSEVVETPFGYHVLEVTAISPTHILPFEDARATLEGEMISTEAATRAHDLSEEVEDRLAGGERLPAIAEALGLSLTRYPFQTLVGDAPDGTAVNRPAADVMEAAFSLPDTTAMAARVDQGATEQAWVEVVDIMPARPQTLEEATPTLKAELEESRLQAALTDAAQKAQEALNAGTPLATLQTRVGGDFTESEPFTRDGTDAPAWLEPSALQTLFEMEDGAPLPAPLSPTAETRVLLTVHHAPAKVLTEDEHAQLLEDLQKQVHNDVTRAFFSHIQNAADVKLYTSRLLSAFRAQGVPDEALKNLQ